MSARSTDEGWHDVLPQAMRSRVCDACRVPLNVLPPQAVLHAVLPGMDFGAPGFHEIVANALRFDTVAQLRLWVGARIPETPFCGVLKTTPTITKEAPHPAG